MGKRRRLALAAVLAMVLASMALLFGGNVTAASITVPYGTAVADADLDGYPSTGGWTDALSTTIPLENGASAPYGSATLYAKHDGTYVYFRIDGSIDVPWSSAGGSHFWLGMQLSPTSSSHHSGGTWDGVFFGLWDGTAYTPQPVYPPTGVDTNGFSKPPAKDTSQDITGKMRYSGTSAPYGFTAEWKKPLNSGDASDVALKADGSTTYNFFFTTDSNGGGSAGGTVDHNAVTNSNTMRFAVPSGPNTPPQAGLTAPDGGEVWSGASSHKIWWNMSDAETATASLKVWVNFSSDGGTTYSPITGAQGISGFANPCSFAWTVPSISTTQARVKVTVVDAGGASASDASLANFAIDPTAPTVTAFSPANGATGVSLTTQVRVSFSEAMDPTSTGQAFSLTRVDTGAAVAGTTTWSGNDLIFTPSAALGPGLVYRAQVAATAKDASNPGNPLGTAASASFTTADTTPPVIASVSALPSPQEAGGRVNVSATVTEDGALAGVWFEVRDPAGTLLGNFTAGHDSGTGRYFHDAAYAHPGTHSFRVSAKDAAGNWNAVAGTFAVVDTVPPTIQHVPVTQAVKGTPIAINASISDVDAVSNARVDYTDVLGVRSNVSMTLSGSLYTYAIPAQGQLGTLTYFIWARDPTGNAARTPSYSVTVVGSDTTPPSITGVAALPSPQNAGGAVNITASITDNVGLGPVNVVVTAPGGGSLGNFSMSAVGATNAFYLNRTYAGLGTYGFVIWALDGSNNPARAQGSFAIIDAMPPVFLSVSVTPPATEIGGAVNITAGITDNVAVAGVRVALTGPGGSLILNQSLSGGSGLYWIVLVPGVLGNLSFLLIATDSSGNAATHAGGFSVTDSTPPVAVAGPDVTVWIGSTVTFNGSASRDNGRIVNYTWTFVYNGTNVSLFGPVASFTFFAAGRYNVTLKVTDEAGLQGTAGRTVTVTTDTTPPPEPQNVLVVPAAASCLVVTWTASLAPDLASYRLYRWNQTRTDFDLIANLPADATTYTDCGLQDDSVYSYWVVAVDTSGNVSPPSPIDGGRTMARASTESDLGLLYESVISVLTVAVLILAVLWIEERRSKRPPGPAKP